jgi:hypothetical protein
VKDAESLLLTGGVSASKEEESSAGVDVFLLFGERVERRGEREPGVFFGERVEPGVFFGERVE